MTELKCGPDVDEASFADWLGGTRTILDSDAALVTSRVDIQPKARGGRTSDARAKRRDGVDRRKRGSFDTAFAITRGVMESLSSSGRSSGRATPASSERGAARTDAPRRRDAGTVEGAKHRRGGWLKCFGSPSSAIGENFGDTVIPVALREVRSRDATTPARVEKSAVDPPSTGASTNVRRASPSAIAREGSSVLVHQRRRVSETASEGAIETPTRRAARRGGGADVGGAAFATPNVARFGALDRDDALARLLDDDDDGSSARSHRSAPSP
jgi:hypothetical protein